MTNPELNPKWFTQGVTYRLPKSNETNIPKNYRPITCLQTIYKILTSIITERTYNFLDNNNILPTEQKGCKRGSYGCEDHLLINKMLLENSRSSCKNLSTTWIVYRKACDSVPHSWLLRVLELYKVSPTIINFLTIDMTKWKTNLHLNYSDGSIICENLDINNGMFQGDSLSPLLFCLALKPLLYEMNDRRHGYKIREEKINHLFYMDNLKLYEKNDKGLDGLLNTVNKFSDNIGMEFGLGKCEKAAFIRGRLTSTSEIKLNEDTSIRELDQKETYKYLRIDKGDGTQHAKMREKSRKECYRRVKAILHTELNAKNKLEAINTLAIPVVTYIVNGINRNLEEIRRMD